MDPEAIQDLFQELGPVRTRRMFGGQGVYFQGRIFALEVGGEIYLKTGAELRPRLAAAGSCAFAYTKGGTAYQTSYWLMPDEASEDPAAAALWARLALDAAARAEALKKPRARRSAA